MIFACYLTCVGDVGGVFVSLGEKNGGRNAGSGALQYSREFLLSLRNAENTKKTFTDLLPDELVNESEQESARAIRKERKRGKRGGVKKRPRKMLANPASVHDSGEHTINESKQQKL